MNKNMRKYYDVMFWTLGALGIICFLLGIWIGAHPEASKTEWFRAITDFVRNGATLKYVLVSAMFACDVALTWAVVKLIGESRKAKGTK